MSSNLWLSNATHRVFGWNELLEEWNTNLQLPAQVKRVQENLQAATDPNGTHNPRLTQFLTYLNYEQDGIAWFLYECISIRWMYGVVPLNYIRSLVDEIEDLDAQFPVFPGSPYGQTIREFVNANLNADELEEVQMLPQLVPQYDSDSYRTPTRPARADYSYAQRAPFAPLRSTRVQLTVPQAQSSVPQVPRVSRTLSEQFAELYAAKPRKQDIQVRFIRSMNSKNGSDDDVVSIAQVSEDSYNIRYNDKEASLKSKTLAVPRAAVISFLSMTLRMLSVDEEPFETIQFTLPSMPTILVSPENLTSQTRDLIYDSVEATMNYWPVCA